MSPLPDLDRWPERDLCDGCGVIVMRPVYYRGHKYCPGCATIRRRVDAGTQRAKELGEIEGALTAILEGSTEYT